MMGKEAGGLGDSGEEMTGMLLAGNDYNYVQTHAQAIANTDNYNIVSCSNEALETAKMHLKDYAAIDLLLGLERNDGHSLSYYKTFSSSMQHVLQQFTAKGGALLVSGAYIGSDMTADNEQQFLRNVLKCQYAGRSQAQSNELFGLGTNMHYWKEMNEEHYAATATDVLQPVKPAYTAMQYADGYGAAVAYKGADYRLFVMGLPFECIQSEKKRTSIMFGILKYLLQ